jgi:PIN domain nuclease of toxin-antitoxin system
MRVVHRVELESCGHAVASPPEPLTGLPIAIPIEIAVPLPQQHLCLCIGAGLLAGVTTASLWEMAIKMSIGRLLVDLPELERLIPLQGVRWLPIRNAHLLAVGSLESDGDHRDPFDRLLVCQSRTEPMLLLTADLQLQRYGNTVNVIG